MASAWADIKIAARRVTHQTFGRAATYAAPGSVGDPVALTVRWHAAGARVGDLGSDGYAEMVTTRDRVVFDLEELATLGVTPERGGVVTITDEAPPLAVELDTQNEPTGPVADVWLVTRQ